MDDSNQQFSEDQKILIAADDASKLADTAARKAGLPLLQIQTAVASAIGVVCGQRGRQY